MLMDKYPIIIYAGAAILGKVGGEMIITDPIVAKTLAPGKFAIHAVEVAFAVGVIVVGKLWMKRMISAGQESPAEEAAGPGPKSGPRPSH
jgi:predicted tellurium resistance membrane protein TerC